MDALPPLPPLPERVEPGGLPELDDGDLAAVDATLEAAERATTAAMAPHQAQLRELRARRGEVATERRRRQRAAQVAARAAVREAARSGDMPSVAEALAGDGLISDATPLEAVTAFLRSGGEVRFGFATRPGPLAFSNGRSTRSVATWGEARQAYADGWEPGAPGVPGVRVHLTGTRVERVVSAAEVVVRPE
ncbi:MAG: hypothetical protein ACYDAC_03380 [Candidatus Dormibacteria bacterium]